ncbi:MAG: type II toxin-antitoxin system RatA family toxin [Granulosicoccus sp.]|nr:type II toxin-antitoxin system RatA family toxin [Granulosicoccus sp.]
MPSIARSALVSHSAADMYALVCDVESYPDFLPWCQNALVTEQSASHQIATVLIDKRMQGVKFTTRNQLETNSAIHMELIDGPFKRLSGFWQFQPLSDDACKVELSIDFEFKSRILARLLGPAFSKICDSMVAAFVARADQLSKS